MAEEHRSDVERTGREGATGSALAAIRQAPDEMQLRREARRRVLVGGLASAPFVLTLASRPAFASQCSLSGMTSGNLSRHQDIECLGNTPSYWKTHPEMVSQYVIVGACNPISGNDLGQCDDYSVPSIEQLETYIAELMLDADANQMKIAEAQEYLENRKTYPDPMSFFGTPFSAIFGDNYTENADMTIMQALWLDDTPPLPPEGMGDPAPVLAHSAAAWLNATEYGAEVFGLSPQKVVELFQRLVLMDAPGLKDTLETLNSRGG